MCDGDQSFHKVVFFTLHSDFFAHNYFIFVTWLTHMCDKNPSYVWYDSFIRVTWLIHVWAMTHSYVCRDSFECVTWLIHTWDMTHSCTGPVLPNLVVLGVVVSKGRNPLELNVPVSVVKQQCCSELQCVAMWCSAYEGVQCIAVSCSVLQCVAVCCSVLHHDGK